MGAVKKAFKKIGQGIKTVAKGIGGNIKGLAKMAGGALTFNPRLLKEGAKSYANGMKNIVTGAGQVAGGMAAASVGMSPLGAAINGLTGGAASRLACKTFTSAAETVTNGVEGAFKMADGLVHGDMKKVLSPEQREKLGEMREKARALVQERRRRMWDSAFDDAETDAAPAEREKRVTTPKRDR